MNTKLVITYTNASGFKGEISEYHLNSTAAYNAAETITKRLGHEVKIDSIKLLPVKKHLELAPVIQLSKTDKNYSEVK